MHESYYRQYCSGNESAWEGNVHNPRTSHNAVQHTGVAHEPISISHCLPPLLKFDETKLSLAATRQRQSLNIYPSVCLSVPLYFRIYQKPHAQVKVQIFRVHGQQFSRLCLCPSFRLQTRPSLPLSGRLSVCPSVRVYVMGRLSVCLFVCLSVRLSLGGGGRYDVELREQRN